MFCIPLRDRQVALQLLLELCIQQGSLHCALQTVLLLLELWDTGETEQVAKFYKKYFARQFFLFKYSHTNLILFSTSHSCL